MSFIRSFQIAFSRAYDRASFNRRMDRLMDRYYHRFLFIWKNLDDLPGSDNPRVRRIARSIIRGLNRMDRLGRRKNPFKPDPAHDRDIPAKFKERIFEDLTRIHDLGGIG